MVDVVRLRRRGLERRPQGFALVELLVVLAVLGALAVVVLMASARWTQNALGRTCQMERRVIVSAVQAARADNRRNELPPVAGPDGLDGVREAGFLEWGDESRFWRYTGPPEGDAGPLLERADVAAVPLSECPE